MSNTFPEPPGSHAFPEAAVRDLHSGNYSDEEVWLRAFLAALPVSDPPVKVADECLKAFKSRFRY